jgi:hypothetical protein
MSLTSEIEDLEDLAGFVEKLRSSIGGYNVGLLWRGINAAMAKAENDAAAKALASLIANAENHTVTGALGVCYSRQSVKEMANREIRRLRGTGGKSGGILCSDCGGKKRPEEFAEDEYCTCCQWHDD